MTRLTNLPSAVAAARPSRVLAKLSVLVLPGMLLAQQAFAQSLGKQMTAASTDLGAGGGYVLELLGYILGGAALLVGFFTVWQHTKNPNGQSRLGYGVVSVIVGGCFLAASLFGSFASNTVAGANVTNTGTAQQMTFQ